MTESARELEIARPFPSLPYGVSVSGRDDAVLYVKCEHLRQIRIGGDLMCCRACGSLRWIHDCEHRPLLVTLSTFEKMTGYSYTSGLRDGYERARWELRKRGRLTYHRFTAWAAYKRRWERHYARTSP